MSEKEFPKLTILSEKGRGSKFVLKKLKYSCGRIDSNDIALEDASVSSKHCEFVKRGETFLVRDLGSTNGIIVNDVSVNDRILSNGDIIKVGIVELLFDGIDSAPDKIKLPESQVKVKVKTGIDLDAFEKESDTIEKKKDIFPFADSGSKDLKSRLPLLVITTVIILLVLVVLGLLAWFFSVFVF